MTYDNSSIIALIKWGIKAIALDFNVLLALTALANTKETEAITYGARVANTEEASALTPETSAIVKDAALSAQEAKKMERRNTTPIVYDETMYVDS
jgi:hypothetical protein